MTTQLIPEQIGPYRVLRPIGQGGMSEVYVVEDPSSKAQLALKWLVELGDAVPRFNREYEALTRLNHPGIVRVYNYGIHAGRPWFSMELLEGQSLQSWMKRRGRPGQVARTSEVYRVGYYLCAALAYIHRRNLIHRDLKSANVMVLPDGRIKLLDFGTAHLLDPVEAITTEGEFIGTFAYASPEQFRGVPIDHRADLYTLGVLLYRLATGRRPFASNTPVELAKMHLRTPPVAPTVHVPSLPKSLNDLILQLMSKKAEDRPQKASAVLKTLVEIAGQPINMSSFGLAMRTDRPIGRERELKTIERIIDRTVGRSVVVTGHPGSGLASFVNQAASDARSRDIEVIVCTLHAQDPLGKFVSTLIGVLSQYFEEPSKNIETAMSALLDMVDRPVVSRWKNRELLNVAMATLVVHAVRVLKKPLLFVIHHQHLATPLTMDVFARMAHVSRSEGHSVQFLFAVEQGALTTNPLTKQRFPGALHLALKPLSVREVALSVGSLLYRRPPPTRLARLIHRFSGGEPIWVEQVVQTLVDSGHLRALGAEGNHLEWEREGAELLSVPQTAKVNILERFCMLPIQWRLILEAAAMCGESIPVPIVARSVGWDLDTTRFVVEHLVQESWLVWIVEGEVVSWLRPLDSRVILQQIDPLRRTVFFRALARKIDRLPASEALVRVLLSDGQTRRAMELTVTCAKEYIADHKIRLALDLLDEVVEAVRDYPELDRVFSGRLHLMHADCLMRLRPTDPKLGRSLTIARALANRRVTMTRIELLQARLHRQLGHFSGFWKYVKRAWEHASETHDDGLKSRVCAYQMHSWMNRGNLIKAGHWMEQCVAFAQATTEERVLAYGALCQGHYQLVRGEFKASEASLNSAMTRFETTGDQQGMWMVLPVWAETLRFQGRFSEVLVRLYEALPDARDSETPLHYYQILLAIARCETDLCRLGLAQECVDELEVNLRRGEQLSLRLDVMIMKGRIQIMSGQYRKGLSILQETYERAILAQLPVISEYARALMAEALCGLNSREQAMGMFESASLGLLATGHVSVQVLGATSWARAMGDQVDTEVFLSSVRTVMEREPVLVLEMETLIAQGRFFRHHKRNKESRAHVQRIVAHLNTIAKQLNATDRAALRIHPWSVQLRFAVQ